MLFPKAILEAEWAADATFREAMAIKRERLRALRAEKKKPLAEKGNLRALRMKRKKKRKPS